MPSLTSCVRVTFLHGSQLILTVTVLVARNLHGITTHLLLLRGRGNWKLSLQSQKIRSKRLERNIWHANAKNLEQRFVSCKYFSYLDERDPAIQFRSYDDHHRPRYLTCIYFSHWYESFNLRKSICGRDAKRNTHARMCFLLYMLQFNYNNCGPVYSDTIWYSREMTGFYIFFLQVSSLPSFNRVISCLDFRSKHNSHRKTRVKYLVCGVVLCHKVSSFAVAKWLNLMTRLL